MRRIYLDHNATTPLRREAREAMLAALEAFGNPSSLHWFGQQARAVLDDARGCVAELVSGQASEVVFTGSGTEADNLALRGLAAGARDARRTILYSAIEHHAVMNAARALAEEGWRVEAIRARPDGTVDLDDLERRIDGDTLVVAVMLANNETGTLQPVDRVVEMARRHGARVHCDAVQAAGKLPLDAPALGVDTMAVSAHKLYGPKGVGALWVRRGTPMKPLLRGGSQERNRRPGTENVPAVAGFGAACAAAAAERATLAPRLAALRDRLEQRLLTIDGAVVNGTAERVANTSNMSFEAVEAESLLMALDLAGVAVSTGAACAAGAVEPSHVLRAMGLRPERVEASLRFSVGRDTTEADVDEAAAAVAEAIARHRSRSPVRAR